MIQERDAEQVGALAESAGQHTILWAGCGIATGRVIMSTNPGSGIHQDHWFEHLAGMHDGERERSDGDEIDADDPMFGIEPAH